MHTSLLLRLSFFAGLSVAANDNVLFFVNTDRDACTIGSQSMVAPNNTAHGGLCAYVDSIPMVWACPAPDGICWNGAQECSGSNDTDPGKNQIGCSGYGSQWCCAKGWESCSKTTNQINVCWSNFTNPNKGLSLDAANKIESSSLSVLSSQSSQSAASALSSRLSALSAGAAVPTTSSSSSMTPTSLRPTEATAPAAVTSPATSSKSSSSSLSGGAIGGIAVAAVAGGVMITCAAFFIWRRRHAQRKAKEAKGTPQGGSEEAAPDYKPPLETNAPYVYHEAPTHEAASELEPTPQRHELSG